MNKSHVEKTLERLQREEDLILKKLTESANRDSRIAKLRLESLKHFTLGDFAQSVIGTTVFSLPMILNTSFWEYIPNLSTGFLFFVHLIVTACFVLALNYEYRDSVIFDKKFYKRFVKRTFYVYFSSMMMISLLLILANKITLTTTNIDVARNYLAAMSMGIVGSVTFSFLKK